MKRRNWQSDVRTVRLRACSLTCSSPSSTFRLRARRKEKPHNHLAGPNVLSTSKRQIVPLQRTLLQRRDGLLRLQHGVRPLQCRPWSRSWSSRLLLLIYYKLRWETSWHYEHDAWAPNNFPPWNPPDLQTISPYSSLVTQFLRLQNCFGSSDFSHIPSRYTDRVSRTYSGDRAILFLLI